MNKLLLLITLILTVFSVVVLVYTRQLVSNTFSEPKANADFCLSSISESCIAKYSSKGIIRNDKLVINNQELTISSTENPFLGKLEENSFVKVLMNTTTEDQDEILQEVDIRSLNTVANFEKCVDITASYYKKGSFAIAIGDSIAEQINSLIILTECDQLETDLSLNLEEFVSITKVLNED